MFKQAHKWILASSSPRRRDMLNRYCFDFTPHSPFVDESIKDNENPLAYTKRIAQKKARFVANLHKNIPVVIAADTIIALGKEIITKPDNQKSALKSLLNLNGKVHDVYTAVAIHLSEQNNIYFYAKTKVEFFSHPTKLLESYIQTKEYLDKSGAYSIEELGTFLIKKINGSWNSVVGFPIELFIQHALSANLIKPI
ncbi:MAG: septum formation protein Maf [SAR324 cluster bacterium]|nr:septum formation protein Maf [SAR324 cluster bacterium]